jgi:GTPase SAR1 family protein
MGENIYSFAARNFLDAYSNTDYRMPLQDQQLDRFYVSREEGASRLELLKKEIMWGAEKHLATKFILSGHVGCGKSTELNRLTRDLERDEVTRQNLLVVSYSVNEILDLQGIDYTDIAFSVVVALYNKLQQLDIAIPPQEVQKVSDWINREVETFTRKTVQAEIDVGTTEGLGRLLSLISLIGISVKGRGERFEETRYRVRKRAPELRDLVNSIIWKIKEITGKNILLVIDDLDKLPRMEALQVFREEGPFLTLLDCMAIYTAPVSLMYELGDSPALEPYKTYQVPMFNVFRKENRQVNEEGVAKLEEMVHRRVHPILFEEGVVRRLALASGGVARHLVKMVQDCCLYCATFNIPKINHKVVDWVINEFKKDYSRRLTHDDYLNLKKVYELKECPGLENAWEYLQSLCVLEYSNGNYWYDVHPVVELLLREKGLI